MEITKQFRRIPFLRKQALPGYAVLVVLAGLAEATQAADITVMNNDPTGPGSFHQAVLDAQPGDQILFSEALRGSNIGTGVNLDKNLTVVGLGNDLTFSTWFEVRSGVTVTLNSVNIWRGGWLHNYGTVTLINSTLSDPITAMVVNTSGAEMKIINCNAFGAGAFNGDGFIINVGAMELSDCTVSGNEGDRPLQNYGTMVVHNCIVSGNTGIDGSVINNLPTSTMAIVNSTVQGNTSFGQAGGIENSGTLTILDSTVAQNTAPNHGGIRNDGVLKVLNSNISGNIANPFFWGHRDEVDLDTFAPADVGAGIGNYGSLEIINSTVQGNIANPFVYEYPEEYLDVPEFTPFHLAGGISSTVGTLTVANSIVWGNTPNQIRATGPSTVSHSNVQGSGAPQSWSLSGVTDGGGNIDGDPLFDANLHLQAGSPCIDSGDNGLLPADTYDLDGDNNISEPIPFDGAGNARVAGTSVDMGAFESTPVVHYSWSGVLQPINSDGSSVFKAGSTIPVKFQLIDGSSGITDVVAWLSYTIINNNVPGLVNEATSTSAATTGNLFRYDPTSHQYIYNWSTKGLSSGVYQLTIELDDGASHTLIVALR